MTRQERLWIAAGVLFHLIFLLLAARVNGWSLQPLIDAHDGNFYITHLQDPLLLSPPEWWDNVPYRGLRVGYVVLALAFRWLGEIPALALVNLIAMGTGVWAIRWIAKRHNVDPLLPSIVWILNPGAQVSTALLLPDVVAWTAILLALIALHDRRWVAATVLGVLAVATKEASLAALGFVGLVAFRRNPRNLIPAAAGGVWHLALLGLLAARFGSSFHESFLTWPFVGWVRVFDRWAPNQQLSRLVAVFALVSAVVVVAAWWRRRSFFLAAAVGHALLMVLLDGVVLEWFSNTLRLAGLFWPLLFATGALTSTGGLPERGQRPQVPVPKIGRQQYGR